MPSHTSTWLGVTLVQTTYTLSTKCTKPIAKTLNKVIRKAVGLDGVTRTPQ
jgi:hypothetical protein